MTASSSPLLTAQGLLYVELLKRCVTNMIYRDRAIRYLWDDSSDEVYLPFDEARRAAAKDWPSEAHTMIGLRRLENVQELVLDLLAREVPGDLIETGVWRGGSVIFMRGLLKALEVTDRRVWAADSFEWFPYKAEHGLSERSYSSPEFGGGPRGLSWQEYPPEIQSHIAPLVEGSSLEQVRERFERYGMLDDQVRFLPGWFRETLPSAPIEQLALLRLDGDLYDSTYDALEALYPRLSVGGYVVVDDYGMFAECRGAVHDYLDAAGGSADVQWVDDEAVFWRKGS